MNPLAANVVAGLEKQFQTCMFKGGKSICLVAIGRRKCCAFVKTINGYGTRITTGRSIKMRVNKFSYGHYSKMLFQ